jgi:hypothetical protein
MTKDLALGRLLGRREAFNVMAARCSAADAALLRDMRDQKLYLDHADDWDEFCTTFLHTSKDSANRVIRYLEEFGPSYFEVSQYARISPTIYRAIAPAIQDNTIQHNGEVIEIVPENSDKVAAAVAELRKAVKTAAPAPEPVPPADPIPALDKHCKELLDEITSLIALRQHDRRIEASIGYLKSRLDRIELTI